MVTAGVVLADGSALGVGERLGSRGLVGARVEVLAAAGRRVGVCVLVRAGLVALGLDEVQAHSRQVSRTKKPMRR